MSQDLVIKTTARLQEASEPDRHKPIIRIDERDGRTTLSHISDAYELANTIRASIDSGRDNPFRPDGEIYRMTDPIVDFYKFGPNRSGTQTPTYADLAQSAADAKAKTDKRSKACRLWKRRAQQKAPDESQSEAEPRKRSCWRKWFCCCCYCVGESGRPKGITQMNENGRLNENIDHYNTATAAQGPKSQDLIISNSKQADKTAHRRTTNDNSTNWDSNAPVAIKIHTDTNQAPPAPTPVKQTKVVIVDELPSEQVHNITESRNPNQLGADFKDNIDSKTTNGTFRRVEEAAGAGKKTAPKSTTSKCVVS